MQPPVLLDDFCCGFLVAQVADHHQWRLDTKFTKLIRTKRLFYVVYWYHLTANESINLTYLNKCFHSRASISRVLINDGGRDHSVFSADLRSVIYHFVFNIVAYYIDNLYCIDYITSVIQITSVELLHRIPTRTSKHVGEGVLIEVHSEVKTLSE